MIILEYNGKKPQISKDVFIAPGAAIIGDVFIGEEASIWFGAVIRGDLGKICIGSGSSIQDNVVIHAAPNCGVVIEEDVTVGHGAIIHGCRIGSRALIGMQSVLQDFCEIGEEAIIAAGSVVTERMIIPARHLAAGVPAQIKKEITGKSLAGGNSGEQSYRKIAQSYLKQGIGYKAK